MDENNGGYAFPWCGDLNETPFINLGMTKRDYFAAKALEGLLCGLLADGTHFDIDASANVLAKSSFILADAMLRARE